MLSLARFSSNFRLHVTGMLAVKWSSWQRWTDRKWYSLCRGFSMTRGGSAQHCQTSLPFRWPATLHVFKIWRNQEGRKKQPKIERKEKKKRWWKWFCLCGAAGGLRWHASGGTAGQSVWSLPTLPAGHGIRSVNAFSALCFCWWGWGCWWLNSSPGRSVNVLRQWACSCQFSRLQAD